MIKKLLILLLLSSVSWGQQSGIKPILSRQINWSHPLSRGLVGCWLMNEGSGSIVNDLSGNGGTGIITGATWASGMYGPAIDFSGTSQYIVCANSPAKDVGGKDFTVIVRFKADNISGDPMIISKDKFLDHGFFLRIDDDGSFDSNVNYNTTDAIIYGTFGSINIGRWYDVAMVHRGSSNKTSYHYIDGGYVSVSGAGNGTYVESTFNLTIGATSHNPTLYGFDGLIDHVFFYHRALSASEILNLYRSPFCMFEVDL